MGFLKKEISTTWGLIVIFGAAVILFGGAFTYYYRMAPTTYDYEIQGSVAVNKTSTAATTDATKDWKTYTNTTYGFSFKYPKDWTIKETGPEDPGAILNNISFDGTNNVNAFISIGVVDFNKFSVSANLSDKTLNGYVEHSRNKAGITSTKLGGINGVEYDGNNIGDSSSSDKSIYILRNGVIYEIGTMHKKTDKAIETTFNNIVSTFQFTK